MPVAETDVIPGSRKEEDSGAGEASIAGIKGGKRLRESRFLLVLGAVAALLLALAVYDAVAFLMDAYSASTLLGGFYSLLMLVVIATIGWWVRGIVSELRAINDISRLRNRGESLTRASCDPRLSDDLRAYVGELSAHYRHDARLRGRLAGLPSRLEQLSTRRGLEGREGISEISKTLYGDIDRQALDLVVKRAQQTALMTAVSRIPLLDLIIVLWRSLSLTLEIAKLYGGRPGRIGLLRLSRLCLYNVVFADVTQVAADILMQAMGDRALSAISAQAAQGMGVGLMLGRLGLEAMRICRAVPFCGEEAYQPSFKKLYSAMTALVKQAMKRKPSDESIAHRHPAGHAE